MLAVQGISNSSSVKNGSTGEIINGTNPNSGNLTESIGNETNTYDPVSYSYRGPTWILFFSFVVTVIIALYFHGIAYSVTGYLTLTFSFP